METTEREDLSRYRMNYMSELDELYEKYGADAVYSAKEKIFRALVRLDRGHSKNLSNLPDDKKELVVKICCLWITYNPDYEFSNDYTQIRRL